MTGPTYFIGGVPLTTPPSTNQGLIWDGNEWKPVDPVVKGSYYDLSVPGGAGVVGGSVTALTGLFESASLVALASAGSAQSAFYLDPADFTDLSAVGLSRFLRLKVRAIVNAVAPAINFTFGLRPVLTWGGASGTNPTVATVDTATTSIAISAPAAAGPSQAVSADVAFPAAGWYVLACVTSGTTAAGSSTVVAARLQFRYA